MAMDDGDDDDENDDEDDDDDDDDEGLIKMLKELKSPQKDSTAWCSLSDKLQMAEVSVFYYQLLSRTELRLVF